MFQLRAQASRNPTVACCKLCPTGNPPAPHQAAKPALTDSVPAA